MLNFEIISIQGNIINVNKITSTYSSMKNLRYKTNKSDNLFNSMDAIFLHKIKSSKKLSFKKKLDLPSLKLDIATTFSSNIFEKHIMTKSLSDNNYLTSNKSNLIINSKLCLISKFSGSSLWRQYNPSLIVL